jgi:phage N-6-adenine-methyltransferase
MSKVCDVGKGQSDCARATNSGEEEWYTPPRLLEAAREVLGGIDLDPASDTLAQAHVKAARFFTRDEDGLAQSWHGRVWLNPPYAGAQVRDFTTKLCEEYEAGDVTAAVLLTNNATDTAWWQRAAKAAAAVCFPLGRVRFLRPGGEEAETPSQGQSVLYFGLAIPAFAATFGAFGVVYRSERRRRSP